MTPQATWLVSSFVIIGGLLNSWRGEIHQREGFAGVQQREAEAELAIVKARRLSMAAERKSVQLHGGRRKASAASDASDSPPDSPGTWSGSRAAMDVDLLPDR